MEDYNSRNHAFVTVAKQYLDQGVPDALAALRLQDASLVGIDPYSLNDTTDPYYIIRAKVLRECSSNIWYFIREVVRLPQKTNSIYPVLTSLLLQHVQSFQRNESSFTVQHRREGATTNWILTAVWSVLFPVVAEHPVLFTASWEARDRVSAGCKTILKSLPKYMRAGGRCPTVIQQHPHRAGMNVGLLQGKQSLAISVDSAERIINLKGFMDEIIVHNTSMIDILRGPTARLRSFNASLPKQGSPNWDYFVDLQANSKRADGLIKPKVLRGDLQLGAILHDN